MSDKKTNIWQTFKSVVPGGRISKRFIKRKVSVKQIEKAKSSSIGNSPLKEEHELKGNSKNKFINIKRGRRKEDALDANQSAIPSSHDRFSDDNLKRKVKTHFHNYIIALLNSKLNIQPNSRTIMRFGKMNSEITQNITVEYNKELFKKKIKDIIIYVSNKYQNKNINLECLEYIMKNPKTNEEVLKLLDMTYEDMYLNLYLKSTKKSFPNEASDESYEKHKEKLLSKFGEEYSKKFNENAENLISFFEKCKQRKLRKKKPTHPTDELNNNPSSNPNSNASTGISIHPKNNMEEKNGNEQLKVPEKSEKKIQTETSPFDCVSHPDYQSVQSALSDRSEQIFLYS